MTDFNALAPNYTAPADSLAGFHGPILLKGGTRGGEGDGREGDRREGEGVGEEKEGDICFFPELTFSP